MCVAAEGRWFDGPHATFRRREPLSLIKLLIKLFVVLCECVKLINLEPSRRLSMFNASGEKRSIRVRTRLFHPREVFNEFFNASTQDIIGKPSWSQDFGGRSVGGFCIISICISIDHPTDFMAINWGVSDYFSSRKWMKMKFLCWRCQGQTRGLKPWRCPRKLNKALVGRLQNINHSLNCHCKRRIKM